ncbi:MAG: universal stress protein [Acidobacteria bacterium]|nr:universal stress protein [Acidobacteriota bacterium]
MNPLDYVPGRDDAMAPDTEPELAHDAADAAEAAPDLDTACRPVSDLPPAPRHIVCVVNGDGRQAVVGRAAAIARRAGGTLEVAHHQAAPDAFQTWLDEHRQPSDTAAALSIRVASLDSLSTAAVAERVRRTTTDLIVVGQEPRSGSRYWRKGAFAWSLAQAIDCPMLVVPSGEAPSENVPPFRDVVCAVDFSAASVRAALHAARIAHDAHGSLTMVNVLEGFPYDTVYSGADAGRLIREHSTRIRTARRGLRAMIPVEAVPARRLSTRAMLGMPSDTILRQAAEHRADLIALGLTRQANGGRWALPSVVRTVMRRSKVPVLVVPGPRVASKPWMARVAKILMTLMGA